MQPRITVITLGVDDLAAEVRFEPGPGRTTARLGKLVLLDGAGTVEASIELLDGAGDLPPRAVVRSADAKIDLDRLLPLAALAPASLGRIDVAGGKIDLAAAALELGSAEGGPLPGVPLVFGKDGALALDVHVDRLGLSAPSQDVAVNGLKLEKEMRYGPDSPAVRLAG
mgnify:CR=1 FL=1